LFGWEKYSLNCQARSRYEKIDLDGDDAVRLMFMANSSQKGASKIAQQFELYGLLEPCGYCFGKIKNC